MGAAAQAAAAATRRERQATPKSTTTLAWATATSSAATTIHWLTWTVTDAEVRFQITCCRSRRADRVTAPPANARRLVLSGWASCHTHSFSECHSRHCDIGCLRVKGLVC